MIGHIRSSTPLYNEKSLPLGSHTFPGQFMPYRFFHDVMVLSYAAMLEAHVESLHLFGTLLNAPVVARLHGIFYAQQWNPY